MYNNPRIFFLDPQTFYEVLKEWEKHTTENKSKVITYRYKGNEIFIYGYEDVGSASQIFIKKGEYSGLGEISIFRKYSLNKRKTLSFIELLGKTEDDKGYKVRLRNIYDYYHNN